MLMYDAGELLLALIIILAGAELFTNAIEHVGERYHLSQGLVGSVLAAVATALPETIVPIVAVFFGGVGIKVREHVGIGAILGAPLMLASVALALFIPLQQAAPRLLASAALVLIYIMYVRNTVRASRYLVQQGHGTVADSPLLLARLRLP